MTGVDELVAWLRAIWDDEEALARRVADRYVVRNPDRDDDGQPYWPLPSVEASLRGRIDPDIAAGLDLIKAYNPDRVLAEVEAKRRILAEVEYEIHDATKRDTGDGLGLSHTILSLLALPYAGRDGWREEWRA